MNVKQIQQLLELLRQANKLTGDEEMFLSWTGKEDAAAFFSEQLGASL